MYVRTRCLLSSALVGLLGRPLAYIHIYAVICRRVCMCIARSLYKLVPPRCMH